jgi:hypothetical protein
MVKRIQETTNDDIMNFSLMSYTSIKVHLDEKIRKNPLTNVANYIILRFKSRKMYLFSQKRGGYGTLNQTWI